MLLHNSKTKSQAVVALWKDPAPMVSSKYCGSESTAGDCETCHSLVQWGKVTSDITLIPWQETTANFWKRGSVNPVCLEEPSMWQSVTAAHVTEGVNVLLTTPYDIKINFMQIFISCNWGWVNNHGSRFHMQIRFKYLRHSYPKNTACHKTFLFVT